MSATQKKKAGAKKTSIPEETNSFSLLKPFSFTDWGYRMPQLGVAEKRARLHDEGAAYFEEEGLADLANEERELAKWWRKLLVFPESKAKSDYEECERKARNEIDILLARAEKFDRPLFHLWMLINNLLDGLHALAAHGNKKAGEKLTHALDRAVGNLEMLAFHNPDLFRESARKGFGFPAIISPNLEKIADNARLTELLQVGQEYHLAILPTGKRGRKWKFQDRANSLAVRLVSYINWHRNLYAIHADEARRLRRQLPVWLPEAMKLQPFSKASWPKWAAVGWQVIASISPNGRPGKHPAFYDRATQICNARSSRKDPAFERKTRASPSIPEQDIKERLFSAFKVIAGISSR